MDATERVDVRVEDHRRTAQFRTGCGLSRIDRVISAHRRAVGTGASPVQDHDCVLNGAPAGRIEIDGQLAAVSQQQARMRADARRTAGGAGLTKQMG